MLELGPAQPPLRPRPSCRGRGCASGGPATAETLVTLDDVERTLHHRRPADLRRRRPARSASPGSWAGRRPRSPTATTDVLLEMAWFQPIGDRPDVAAPRAAHRGIGPLRAGRRPRGHRPRRRRASCELLGDRRHDRRRGRSTCGASCPTARRSACARAGSTGILGTRSRRDADDRSACSSPIGFAATAAATATTSTSRSHLAATTRRPRSTSSRRSPATTATSGSAQTVPPSAHIGAPHRPPAGSPAACGARSSASGSPRRMPMPFLAPGDLARAGSAPSGIEIDQPARRGGVGAAHLAAARARRRRSRYNATHRNEGVGLFEIGHVFLPHPTPTSRSCPTSASSSAPCSPGRDAAAAVEAWYVVADVLDCGGVEIVERPRSRACTRPGPRLVVDGDERGGRGGRDRSGGRSRDEGIGERVGVARGRPGPRCWPCRTATGRTGRSAGSRRATSTWPSWSTTRSPPTRSRRRCATRAGELLVGPPVRRVPGRAASATGRAQPRFALRLQAPDRTLTDDDVAEVRQRCIDAVEQAHGAKLRGLRFAATMRRSRCGRSRRVRAVPTTNARKRRACRGTGCPVRACVRGRSTSAAVSTVSALGVGERPIPQLVLLHGGAQNAHDLATPSRSALDRAARRRSTSPAHGRLSTGMRTATDRPVDATPDGRAATAVRARSHRTAAGDRRHVRRRAHVGLPGVASPRSRPQSSSSSTSRRNRSREGRPDHRVHQRPRVARDLRCPARADDRLQPDALGVVAATRAAPQRASARAMAAGSGGTTCCGSVEEDADPEAIARDFGSMSGRRRRRSPARRSCCRRGLSGVVGDEDVAEARVAGSRPRRSTPVDGAGHGRSRVTSPSSWRRIIERFVFGSIAAFAGHGPN